MTLWDRMLITLFMFAMVLTTWREIETRKSDDMAICQLQNSYETCFQTINR